MIAAIACAVCLVSVVSAEITSLKTVRVTTVVANHKAVQDITVDPSRNTVLIAIGQVQDFDDFKSSVNLHDFNTGYAALKDVAGGTCLIKPVPESMREHIPGLNPVTEEQGEKLVNNMTTMYWYKDPKVLDYEEVRRQAGEILAEFCRDYKTYNLVPRSSNSQILSSQSNEQRVKREQCHYFCGFCFNVIDGSQDDVVDFEFQGLEK